MSSIAQGASNPYYNEPTWDGVLDLSGSVAEPMTEAWGGTPATVGDTSFLGSLGSGISDFTSSLGDLGSGLAGLFRDGGASTSTVGSADGGSSLFGKGSNIMGIANIGMGLANYFQNKDKLKMMEQGLQDQLKNSELARSKTADDLITQAGVRGSLASAVGADTSPYTSVANRYSKYQTSVPTVANQYNNTNTSPEMAAGRMMLNKDTKPEYAAKLADTKKRRESL
jgi:hypothetical protein